MGCSSLVYFFAPRGGTGCSSDECGIESAAADCSLHLFSLGYASGVSRPCPVAAGCGFHDARAGFCLLGALTVAERRLLGFRHSSPRAAKGWPEIGFEAGNQTVNAVMTGVKKLLVPLVQVKSDILSESRAGLGSVNPKEMFGQYIV